ncbi:MAG TPA: ATP-binding protein [Bacteroidia bacterium]|nr:ATP-binding protein [Bacteroidia bacterium]
MGGLLPDPNIPIPIIAQNIIAYAVAFAMAMYFPYYFYKAFQLKKMKFYAYWGNILFLFGPFLLVFVIPYLITKDFALSRKLTMIVPFLYTVSFLYSLRNAIKNKDQELLNVGSKNDIRGMYVAVILFGTLPLIGFFETNLNDLLKPVLHFHNGSQVVEILVTNSGLLVMIALFVRQTIRQSKAEYDKLLTSERQLQELNSELTLKVKERTKELELVNEQRTNAFINLAHETKTPLTLIINYLNDYIKKYGKPGDEELMILKKSIGSLTKDIINFFDMEKIEKGINMYDHNHISDFSRLLNESIILFKVYAAKKQIQISTDIREKIFIKADPSSLCRIVNNLIENAIKYTPESGEIEVILTSIDKQIYFSVRDTGIGIPVSLQAKIFEPFYQIHSEKANFQGMGLGLSLVKENVVQLNGGIEIQSETGTGTEVIVKFPAYERLESDLVLEFTDDTAIYFDVEKIKIQEQPFDDNKSTIMVVEDSVSLLTYMVKTLQPKYNIYFALNGEEALKKLKEVKQLDLIISDVMMDNGDGFFLYKHVLACKNFSHIPFIFLTAKITMEDKLCGLSLGAIDYICKPFSMEELEKKIDSILNNLLNQRNALIGQAYRTLVNNSDNREFSTTNNPSTFETNCLKYNLTTREIDVIRLMADGKINKEIGYSLKISLDTVKKHISNSYEKVGVNNKIELLKKLGIQNIEN